MRFFVLSLFSIVFAACGANGNLAPVGKDGTDTASTATLSQITAGDGFTCGIDEAGQMLCWGAQLDNLSTAPIGQLHHR